MKFIPTYITLFLSFFLIANIQAQNSDSTRLKSQAQIAVQKVDDHGKWLNVLMPDDLNELPIGLKKTVSNITYKLAVSSVVAHESYSELTVFARVEIPQNPKVLFFGISGLKLSHTGGIIGDAKLVLLGDVPINIGGGNGQLILRGDFNISNGQTVGDLTYITMDCSGFKEMGIAADVVFPRSVLIPCHSNGDKIQDESKKVVGSFQTRVNDWNNILVSINLPKFQVNALDGLVFTVTNATFDFSDMRNSPDVIFPVGYESRHMTYPNSNMWRGVYIQSAEVMLPKAFERKGGRRVSFGTTNFILDNNGVTGLMYAKNILPYDEGNASGWKFSVDEFNVGLEANQLVAAGFKGCIGLPVAAKDSLRYEAMITGDHKYQLTVSPKGNMDFQLWQAKVELDSNSYIKLLVADGQFKPEANLYGRFSISAKMKPEANKSIAEFKGVSFRGMRIRTVSPYFTVDYLGYEGEAKLAGFPVSISDIVLVTNNNRADLAFKLNIILQENAFKGSTRLTIGARFDDHAGHHQYTFDKVRVNSIELKSVKISGALTLDGKVDFINDDPLYGDGFAGGINAKITALGNADIQVRCMFGHSKFRYWFVDGQASFGGGFPILGPLRVHGFAGGAYYRMRKSGSASGMMDPLKPNYTPDVAMGLGIKAGILFNVVKTEVVDGVAEFEVAFNTNGGMKYIGLFGNARFMGKMSGVVNSASKVFEQVGNTVSKQLEGLSDVSKLNKIQELEKYKVSNPTAAGRSIPMDDVGGVSAYLGMMYDFNNQTFHANFDVYVNVVGGLFQGVGSNYRAGYAVMHFDPSDWYVHMGTPTDPIGIRVGIARTDITTKSYFMLGSQVPSSPPPPREVANILGLDTRQLDYMRDLNALGNGRGIAFGSRLDVSTGDINFLILYANFSAGLGFDLMLKQYTSTHCEGSSGPIGINGWYANAQAYAYLQGELGVKVNLWFIKAKFPIITGGAAVLLQAKLPNPFWFQGHLGVRVDVLGGLISGNMRFKLAIGNECKIVRDHPTPIGIDVISDFSPHDTNQVDVFTAPQVTFNFSVDKNIDIDTDQGKKTYRIVMEEFELQEEGQSSGRLIPGRIEWNRAKDVATFYSKDVLPSLSKVKAVVKVSFKEQKGATWQMVYMEGKKAEESRILNLTTGKAPETIPLRNIKYAWPVVGQRNFYRDENNKKGVIQLERGQPYLFNEAGYKQELVIEPKMGGRAHRLPFIYDKGECQLRFDVGQVDGNAVYDFLLISRPLDRDVPTDVKKVAQQISSNDGGDLSVKKLQAHDVKRTDIGKVVLTYSFQSSQYTTFQEKMRSIKTDNTIWRKVSSDVISLQQRVSQAEPFDLHDLVGSKYTDGKPLVQPAAILHDDYFTRDIHPINYKNYPLADNIGFTNRDTSMLGFVPSKAMHVMNTYLSLIEQDNVHDALVKFNLPHIYDLPRVYKADFSDLQNQVVNRFLGKVEQSNYLWLINGYYPFMRHGHYKVNYQYVLPNGAKGTSYVMSYFNPIKLERLGYD